MERTSRTLLWLLVILVAVCLFPFLGLSDFHTKGEPREALMAYDMLADGHWILPLYNDGDVAFKPPFFHWLIALFSLVAGEVNEFTSRLPSALALAALVIGGYVFYARRGSAWTAFLAALIMFTNFEVHRAGMNCRVDMVLTTALVGAMLLLYRWCERRMTGIPWGALLLMGAATLTKGPVGIVLPCLVTWIFALLRGGKFWATTGRFAAVGVGATVLPLVWYLLALSVGGEAFGKMVWEENVLRLTGKMSYESHENPWYYNVVTLVAGYVPYTLLALLGLVAVILRRTRTSAASLWERLRTGLRQMDSVKLFSLLAIVVVFVFYCIPKSKRSVYLLPVYPFIAYFLAGWMEWLWRRHKWVIRTYGSILAVASLLLASVFVAVRLGFVPDTIFTGRHAGENIAFLHALETVPLGVIDMVLVALPVLAALGFLRDVISRTRRNVQGILVQPLVIALTLYLALDGVYQPAVLNVKSDRPVAEAIQEMQPDGPLYEFLSAGAGRFFNINFYTGDRVYIFEEKEPESGLLIIGKDDFDKRFAPKHEADYDFRLRLDSKHRSCDLKDTVQVYEFKKKAQ